MNIADSTAPQRGAAGNSDSAVQAAIDHAKGRVVQAGQALQEKADQAATVTERYVGAHPWTSLAIAGSIGVVVGLLLNRNWKPAAARYRPAGFFYF